MYTLTNYKTKKALREAFNAGKRIACYQPGGLFPGTVNGSCALEGPHYPAPHSWYASADLKDACIVKLDGKSVPACTGCKRPGIVKDKLCASCLTGDDEKGFNSESVTL
jgi:hypothetical protein